MSINWAVDAAIGERLQLLGLTGTTGDDLFALISLIVLWVIGGFVGDLIGKHSKI